MIPPMNDGDKRELFAKCKDGRSAEGAFNLYLKLMKLRTDLMGHHTKRQNIIELQKKELDKIDKDLGELRSECPHTLTKYYPDAAGGSDSHTECKICGAELTKRERGLPRP